MHRIRIGDMLIQAQLIDEMQLNTALAQQRQWGGKLGDILVDHGFLDEMMLWLGLSKQLGVPLVSLPSMVFTKDVLGLLSSDMCEKFEIFPVSRDERTLTIATSDPNNIGALDDVAFRTGLNVKTVMAPHREVVWAVRFYYHADRSPCPPPRVRRQLAPLEPELSTQGPQPPQMEELLRQANEMLRVLVELCIQRGVFTREELWQRLTLTR